MLRLMLINNLINMNQMNAMHEDILVWLRQLLFSTKGRLGPLSYISYHIAVLFVFFLISLLFVKFLSFLVFPLSFVAIYASYIIAIKRLHDFNLSGWYILFGFVPLVSLFLAIFLLFIPGKKVKNKYGLNDGDKRNENFHSGEDYTRNRVLILLGSILGSLIVGFIFSRISGGF